MTRAARGDACPGYGGAPSLREEICADALVCEHAPHPLATAPHGAREIQCAHASRAIPSATSDSGNPEGGVMTAKKTNGPDPWLTPAQMIAELGISKRTWARMRAARTAPKCVRMPGGLKCRRSWFDAWLAEREANAA